MPEMQYRGTFEVPPFTNKFTGSLAQFNTTPNAYRCEISNAIRKYICWKEWNSGWRLEVFAIDALLPYEHYHIVFFEDLQAALHKTLIESDKWQIFVVA